MAIVCVRVRACVCVCVRVSVCVVFCPSFRILSSPPLSFRPSFRPSAPRLQRRRLRLRLAVRLRLPVCGGGGNVGRRAVDAARVVLQLAEHVLGARDAAALLGGAGLRRALRVPCGRRARQLCVRRQ